MIRNRPYKFTSESVTEGHPDKMADRISDAVLDEIIRLDTNGKVACETLLTSSLVIIAGEISTDEYADLHAIVQDTVKDIGYDDPSLGFDYKSCAILNSIHGQSQDINIGVTGKGLHKEQGAGDQGLMFGYATNETEAFMPTPILFAHRITRRLAEVRKKGILDYIGPDGKSQVTVDYMEREPVSVPAVVVASQHREGVDHETMKDDIIRKVIRPSIPDHMITDDTSFHVNETGSFTVGGPQADTGLTGRKIIVDTYGGVGSHGGGAFSGKDPSKVDRSGSYMARYVAKNIVAAGLADRAEVQIAYAIGVARPVSVMVDTHGTARIPEEIIESLVDRHFDLRPSSIIERLDLLRPIYRDTASYGHFGRKGFTWEEIDMADELRDSAGM